MTRSPIAGVLATLLAAAAVGTMSNPAGALRAAEPVAPREPRLGLSHIDLMDLHMVRQSGAPPRLAEQLGSGEIAERYDRAAQSGASWHRWSFYWDLIEQGGDFSWQVPDSIVARDVTHGFRTLGVLQGNPPGVIDPRSGPPGITVPIFRRADGKLTDDPELAESINKTNAWARFVRAAVERYRPGGALAASRGWGEGAGVSAWEIGNEPNVRHFWHGSVEEYVRFLEVAYLTIKWVDPAAIVLHGGIGDDGNAHNWYQEFAETLHAKSVDSPLVSRYNYYFDRAAWHWYTSRDNLVVFPRRAEIILQGQQIAPKPIWVTEVGMPIWSEYPGPCWDSASRGRSTLAEQASFVWQALAEGLAEGVEVMIWFQLYDDCGNGRESYDALGLIRNHEANQCWLTPLAQGCWRYEPASAGVPRPSYDAFRIAASVLVGARVAEDATPASGSYRRVTFIDPNGRRITIAWSLSLSSLNVDLPAAAGQATMYSVEPTGVVRSRTVLPSDGVFRVRLPGLTNRNGPGGTPLMGGRPVMLEEVAGAKLAQGAVDAVGDSTAPMLAVVRELPAVSLPVFDLQIVAGDETALGSYVVYYSEGQPPRTATDWTPYGTVRPWPGSPPTGVVQVAFEGLPGHEYFFTAQASDLAGNWTSLADYPQAATRIAGPSSGTGESRPRRIPHFTFGCTPL